LISYKQRVPDSFELPISAATRYCAVYGQPVKHSASPAMQNAGLAALGLDWRYLAFEVDPQQLRVALEGARRMHFIGLNLTVPHKLLALDCMDELDSSAATWGAVNTVLFEGSDTSGQWRPLRDFSSAPAQTRAKGFNTDADAVVRAIREDLGVVLQGARVLLLGAGGAGRTAALRIAAEGAAQLWLVNRTASKAEDVATEIRTRFPHVQVTVGFPPGKVDLMVNATSLGLRPDDPLPMDPVQFPLSRSAAVFDMVYRPAQTRLLLAAKDAGCQTANGLGMLLYQGARALEIWTGLEAPIAVMRAALEANIYGRQA
jgi:shikimate dehydrogenase